jgi:hypothetical protein
MTGKHEFFAQPRGNPPWCFCRDQACTGWAAYMAWYQGGTGEGAEPDDNVVEVHRLITTLRATLTRHHGELFSSSVDVDTALDLADIERAERLSYAYRTLLSHGGV